MQDSSAFQFLAIDTIHESTTNPRRTFDEAKLYELAESIKHNGLIQPIPHESQPDSLTEAKQVFAPKKPKVVKAKTDGSSKPKPIAAKGTVSKETTRKKAA